MSNAKKTCLHAFWSTFLSVAVVLVAVARYPNYCAAFQPQQHQSQVRAQKNVRDAATRAPIPLRRLARRYLSTSEDIGNETGDDAIGNSLAVKRPALDSNEKKKCSYLFEGKWKRRLDLGDLTIGRKLYGRKLDGCDLLDAKTGPKIFFECGVGRIDARGNWQMVNGMLRLGRKGARKSVTKKRVARLSDKVVELYVSQVRLANGMLEVTTSQEQAEEIAAREKRVPASSLKEGDLLVGTVVRVEPFGVIVDVGANRNGLLHIQRVADLFGKYIKKEEGLEKAGLERNAKIRVAVLSNEKRRLFLDFIPDIKEEAAAEREEKRKEKEEEKEGKDVLESKEDTSKAVQISGGYADMDEDDAAAWAAHGAEDDAGDWAAFAAGDVENDYDEDDEIEDALGISNY